MRNVQIYALNSATDIRRWARTERGSAVAESEVEEPPVQSAEDEQRYQQTAVEEPDEQSERSAANPSRL